MATIPGAMYDLDNRLRSVDALIEAMSCFIPAAPCSELVKTQVETMESLIGALSDLVTLARDDFRAAFTQIKEGSL